jgi:hypothetical protein
MARSLTSRYRERRQWVIPSRCEALATCPASIEIRASTTDIEHTGSLRVHQIAACIRCDNRHCAGRCGEGLTTKSTPS